MTKVKMKVSLANFSLEKIKIKDGKVSIDYLVNVPDGGLTRKQKYSVEEEMQPHSDVVEELSKMKRMLAYQMGLTKLEAVVNSKDFNATKEQKKYIESAVDVILDDVNVSGFSLSGDDLTKVKITGSYNGIGFAGKLFSLDGESQGFEDDAKAIIDFVSDEAYEYLFNMKRADLELPFDKKEKAEQKTD